MIAGSFTGASNESERYELLIERTVAPVPSFPLLSRMFVEPGTRADWELLHELHYKAESLPVGPKFWRLDLEGETIGVLVTGSPKGLLKERHMVFPNLKPGGGETKKTNTHRYVLVNANFRVVSRFVIDTMYRGIGAGYRMMNLASRMEGPIYMEIQSSMSKFNLFGQKAGFRFVRPINSNKYDIGLKFFRTHFQSSPQDYEALIAEVEAKPASEQEVLLQSCKDFYYRVSALEKIGNRRGNGQSKVDGMPLRAILKSLQQVTLASPMYGVWKNPDPKGITPMRLPLSAFDRQPADQALYQ